MHLGEGIQAWEETDNQTQGDPVRNKKAQKEELGAWWVAKTRPYWSRDIWMAENRRLQLSEGSEEKEREMWTA